MFSFFKKKNKNKSKNKVEMVQMIAIPDIRKHLVDSYLERDELKESIKEYEKNNEILIQEANDYKEKYEAALIVSDNLKKQCKDCESEIKQLKKDVSCKMNELREKDEKITKLEEEKILIKNKTQKEYEKAVKNFKEEIIKELKNTKGNLSKDYVLKIIRSY